MATMAEDKDKESDNVRECVSNSDAWSTGVVFEACCIDLIDQKQPKLLGLSWTSHLRDHQYFDELPMLLILKTTVESFLFTYLASFLFPLVSLELFSERDDKKVFVEICCFH